MIYVITAVHNRYKITEKFIDVLLKQSYKDITLILVDDGSTDGTDKMALSKMPNTQIIYGNGNLWWGGALHKAYLWVKKNLNNKRDDYVMFANDDTEFDEEKAGDVDVAGLGNVMMKGTRHLTLRMRMMSAAAMSTMTIATTNTHA